MELKTKLELDLEEAYKELDIIDMELMTAIGDDRHNKLQLKKSILNNIRKLNGRINRIEDMGR